MLWSGEASGKAKQPGVDARASECNEALSLALRSALAKAVSLSVEPADCGPSTGRRSSDRDAVADLTRLKAGGVTDDVLVAYVEGRKITRPLNVDEILRWKSAGLPDAAIKAATRP